MSRSTRLFIVAVAFLAMGCTSKFKMHRDQLDAPSPWPYHHGSIRGTSAYEGGQFDGKLEVAWSNSMGEKAAGPLTISHRTLVFPSTRKRIKFFDAVTGQYRGRLKCKGIPQTGVTVNDSVAFFALGPAKNALYAHNLFNRKVIWKRDVKDASPGSIFVNSSLIISSAGGIVTAINADDGSVQWSFQAEGRLVAPAVHAGGRIFQPDDRGTLYALASSNGKELYRLELEGPVVSSVAADSMVFAATLRGFVYAIDASRGTIVWQAIVDPQVWSAPAIHRGRVYISGSRGIITALDGASGAVLWRFEAGEVIRTSPLLIGAFAIVGTAGGQIFSLDAAQGTVVDRAEVKGSVDFAPITDGDRVFVTTDEGKLTCFGENYELVNQGNQ